MHEAKISKKEIIQLVLWGGLFFVTPLYILSYPRTLVFLLIGLCCFWGLSNRTWLAIMPLVLFVYPQQISGGAGSIKELSVLYNYVPIVISSIIFFYGLKNRSFSIIWKKKMGMLISAILLVLVSYTYYILFNNINDVYYTIFFIILYLLFYYDVRNNKISCFLYFYALDVVFYILSFYAILEYFWNYSPYDNLYYALLKTDYYETIDFLRAKSLCGHPLLLVGFLILYQTCLYARLLITRRRWLEMSNLLLSIFVSFLTISRTGYLIEFFIFIVWGRFFLQNNLKKSLGSIIVPTILVLFVLSYSIEYMYIALDRFDNSTASESNRLAAFQVASVIFENELWGVGLNIRQMFIVYRNQFSSEFTVDVLDNAFLGIICQYGVFSIFFFKLLATPVIDTYRKIKKNMYLRNAFWILCLSLILLMFSFILTIYWPLVTLTASLLAVLCQLYPQESIEICKK